MKKIFLSILITCCFLTGKCQLLPSGNPSPNSPTGYSLYAYPRAGQAFVWTKTDTNWVAAYPSTVWKSSDNTFYKTDGGTGSHWSVWIPSNPGTLTSISQGFGIINSPNPITTTGTITVDSSSGGLITWTLNKKKFDSLSVINFKYSDSSSALSGYVRKGWPVLYTDTANMLAPYLRTVNATNGVATPYIPYAGTGTNRLFRSSSLYWDSVKAALQPFDIIKDYNGATILNIRNRSVSADAVSGLMVWADTSYFGNMSTYGGFRVFGSQSVTTYPELTNSLFIQSGGGNTNGMHIYSDNNNITLTVSDNHTSNSTRTTNPQLVVAADTVGYMGVSSFLGIGIGTKKPNISKWSNALTIFPYNSGHSGIEGVDSSAVIGDSVFIIKSYGGNNLNNSLAKINFGYHGGTNKNTGFLTMGIYKSGVYSDAIIIDSNATTTHTGNIFITKQSPVLVFTRTSFTEPEGLLFRTNSGVNNWGIGPGFAGVAGNMELYNYSIAQQALQVDTLTNTLTTRLDNYYTDVSGSFVSLSKITKGFADARYAPISVAGSVTSIATNNGTGISGGTITSTGTLILDTLNLSTRTWRQKGIDSLQNNINGKQAAISVTGENYLSWSSPTITANAVDVSGTNITGILKTAAFPALTGEATTSAGALAVTLTNSAVIGKVLTGYVSGAGTVAATDNILQAIQKLNGNISGLVTGVSSFNTRTGAVVPVAGDYASLTETLTNKSIVATQLTGTLQAAQFPALTNDVTTSAGSLITTLATVNSNIGAFTNASITVNGKGLITAASSGTAPITSIASTVGISVSTSGGFTTLTNTGLIGANNGLTNSSGTVQFGGTSNQNTTYTHNSNSLTFTQTKGVDNTGGQGLNGTFIINANTVQDAAQNNYSASYGALGFQSSADIILGYKSVYSALNGTSYLNQTGNITGGAQMSAVSAWNLYAGPGNLLNSSGFEVKRPDQQAGQTAFTGLVTTYSGLYVPNLRDSVSIKSQFKNLYTLNLVGLHDTAIINNVIMGNVANFSGLVTSTVTSGSILTASSATTGNIYNHYTNTSGDFLAGIESSTAQNTVIGSLAYAAMVGSSVNKALQLFTNNTVRQTIDGSGTTSFTGDLKLTTAGSGIYVKEGSNATMGTGTLVGGTVTISTTKVTANSRIFVQDTGGGVVANIGALYISAKSAGTSFSVSSSNALDTSTFSWIIIEPS